MGYMSLFQNNIKMCNCCQVSKRIRSFTLLISLSVQKRQDIYHAIGTPSINDFKAVLRMNTVSNIPVTTEDINVVERIFGPDIGALKGKTTRRKPVQVIDDQIEIPKDLIASQYAIKLCVDMMKGKP